MNKRVQIWMSCEEFLALKTLLETETSDVFDEGGPLEPLHVAVEAAFCNSSNWTGYEETALDEPVDCPVANAVRFLIEEKGGL